MRGRIVGVILAFKRKKKKSKFVKYLVPDSVRYMQTNMTPLTEI